MIKKVALLLLIILTGIILSLNFFIPQNSYKTVVEFVGVIPPVSGSPVESNGETVFRFTSTSFSTGMDNIPSIIVSGEESIEIESVKVIVIITGITEEATASEAVSKLADKMNKIVQEIISEKPRKCPLNLIAFE